MIDSRFPELARLTPGEKMELAGELVSAAQDQADASELSEKAVKILENKLADAIADPSTYISWEDLKAAKHDR